MIKTFYVQLNEESIITDVISYEYSDYKKVEINVPLPSKIMSGCYRLINNEVVYVPSLDNAEHINRIITLEEENKKLKEELKQIQTSIASLMSMTLEEK